MNVLGTASTLITATDATVRYLSWPATPDAALATLTPMSSAWFLDHVGPPTLPQRFAWPAIAAGQNLLLSAPTGSGKTLAAFAPILDQLSQAGDGLQCLYLAPLKALSRDAAKNLRRCLRTYPSLRSIQVGLRTGDTAPAIRRQQLQQPPDILLTTPESLLILLSSATAVDFFRSLRWVIVDEIHALANTKRGADLSLSLERLDRSSESPLQRIGLSATCTPLETAARFLVGVERGCTVARVADQGKIELTIEPLPEDTPGFFRRLLARLRPELESQSTTLIFTNTRGLAEKLTWMLKREFAEWAEEIGVHHSALAPPRRRQVERHLKRGRLRVVVSSASLELGIDVGSVDGVVLIHPPRSVMRLLQRVGRSGHQPEKPRRGLILTDHVADLWQAAVTGSASRAGQIEPLRIPRQPLDVLCQHLVSLGISGPWEADAVVELVRGAYPYRDLAQEEFQGCLNYLLGRKANGQEWLPPRLSENDGRYEIANHRTAKLMRRNLGTIVTEENRAVKLIDPERIDDFGQPRSSLLGEVDEWFAERLQPGDRFLLDGRCVEYQRRENASVLVREVMGRPATPQWLGSGLPLHRALAERLYLFRSEAGEWLREGPERLRAWLAEDHQLGPAALEQLAEFFEAQEEASEIPAARQLLMEAVQHEAGVGYFFHAPLPRPATETLARMLTWRLQNRGRRGAGAVGVDLGWWLQLPSGMRLDVAEWRSLLSLVGAEEDCRQALRESFLVRERFAAVAMTGLMVLRNPIGRRRKVGGGDWAERRLFDLVRDGDPGFALLKQAESEVYREVGDIPMTLEYLAELRNWEMRLRWLAEVSPMVAAWFTLPVGAEDSIHQRAATVRERESHLVASPLPNGRGSSQIAPR